MALVRNETLVLLFLLLVYSIIALSVKDPIDVFAQLFWRTATTRPPILIISVLFGWAWVSGECTRAGIALERVCGPGAPLRPVATVRSAVCLLDAVLICRFIPFALAGLGSERWAAWTLVADLFAYAACGAALVWPPSRALGAAPSPETAAAHARYDADLAAETAYARAELLRAAWDAAAAPFAPVTFWHVIVADYATSLAKALGDMHVTACVASTECFNVALSSMPRHDVWWEEQRGPCVKSVVNASALALPFWCRLLQCLAVYRATSETKNLWNALKYATAFPLAFAGYLERFASTPTTRALFVLCSIVQSTATFGWDVFMDWGLVKPQAGGPILGRYAFALREHKSLVFTDGARAKRMYSALIAFNFALRFVWTLAIFGGSPTRGCGMLAFEAAEIVRRTVWALFRIEWEYIHLGLSLDLPDDASDDEVTNRLLADEAIVPGAADDGEETAKVRI